jgi:hypothetical protein
LLGADAKCDNESINDDDDDVRSHQVRSPQVGRGQLLKGSTPQGVNSSRGQLFKGSTAQGFKCSRVQLLQIIGRIEGRKEWKKEGKKGGRKGGKGRKVSRSFCCCCRKGRRGRRRVVWI